MRAAIRRQAVALPEARLDLEGLVAVCYMNGICRYRVEILTRERQLTKSQCTNPPRPLDSPRARSKWTSPGKARKAGVVPVRRDPFAAGLDSQSRKPCVLREVAGGFGLRTHLFEDRPMTVTGFSDRRIRLLEKRSTEIEDAISRAGFGVDSMVSCNPDHARQHLR